MRPNLVLPTMRPAVELEDEVPELDPDAFPMEEYSSLKRSLSGVKDKDRPRHLSPPAHFPDEHEPHRSRNNSADGLRLDIPRLPMAPEIALASLLYLPTPLVVLSSLKTIVLANEAMGRLLGLRTQPGSDQDLDAADSTTDLLKGQTLSQIGIDMLSDGVPVWVSWEKFLDTLTSGLEDGGNLARVRSGETTPLASGALTATPISEVLPRGRSPSRDRTTVHDTVVDVLVSSQRLRSRHSNLKSPGTQSTCRMIISIWTLEDQRFFTLTFTSPLVPTPQNSQPNSHIVPRAKSSTSNRSSRSSQSHTPTSSTSGNLAQSPSEGHASSNTSVSALLPNGAPAKCSHPATFTDFQKVTRMKDAMIRAMHIPVLAMWKDESVVYPNPAARRLLAVHADPTSDDSYDFLSRFKPWSADFSRLLEEDDNPIVSLCRTQKAFSRWQIGLINEKTGKKSNYDVSGHPVFDEKTNEFFAGLIAFKDVTEYTEKIASQTAENEDQFALICDMMPQMLWTTRPDGFHDYFSQRWYDYTGLTPQNSLGLGWKLPFHDEDIPETVRKWQHSLATGETYDVEYRCRRFDGVWRWMLGRAMPLRDSKTGEIIKWFGTCTDIQDIVDARNSGARMRQQLLDVLHHSQMNMWTVNSNLRLTFFEGGPFEGLDPSQTKSDVLGKPIHEVLKDHGDSSNPHLAEELLSSIERIMDGKSELELRENHDNGRWFRSKLVPLRGRKGPNGLLDRHAVEGVIGITTEVTSLRQKEQENIKLLANESAAKEASKMKSSFLANMSHEIRTPIAGVLGMSELLLDTTLDEEQNDFAQNIQRSANSLLTVINDILDFSKIESGRLDVEEVQFSLPLMLKDVAKMLSYAASRKGLDFSSDLSLGSDDLVLLGDPGRIRQILTNLLTNSIKFTSEGYVKMAARTMSSTNEITWVEFTVEDSGIGIEEGVKRRLFKPFSQADSSTARRFGGTGLGLTISKNLVDLMKGTIDLSSKLGSGTLATFTIPFKRAEYVAGGKPLAPMVEVTSFPDRLQSLSCDTSSQTTADGKTHRRTSPSVQSPRSSISVQAQRASLPSGRTPIDSPATEIVRDAVHVLVVEDNPVNQQIAIRFIKSLKFGVSAVWNGREALEYLLKATSPDLTPREKLDYPVPSLILMDVQMPILDGYNATHLLRHHRPYASIDAIRGIPIIAMTASAIRGDRERCEKAGMDDYLAKPVRRAILEKMILKWVAKQSASRRASMTQTDGEKLSLARSGTDHSSNCPDHDAIAAEFLNARSAAMAALTAEAEPASGASHAEGTDRITNRRRRSSKTMTLMAQGVPTGETEGARALRREEADEKARSLRDAKLLSAIEDDHGLAPANNVKHEAGTDLNTAGSSLPVRYHAQGDNEYEGRVMALTKENIERFNSSLGGPNAPSNMMPMPKVLGASPANIPGPPPGLEQPLSAAADTNHHAVVQIPVQAAEGLSTRDTKKGRNELGALKPADRSKSDWSTSTARPDPRNEDRPSAARRRSNSEQWVTSERSDL